MKTFLTTALLIGLSTTALMAAVDLSQLPADLQAKIKGSQAGAAANPIEQYVDMTTKQVGSIQSEVDQLFKDNPYLNSNQIASRLKTGVIDPSSKEALNNLQDSAAWNTVEAKVTDINGDIAVISNTYDYINDTFTFPKACKANPAKTIQGIVKYNNSRQWALYNTDQINPKMLYSFLDNVGQIGTGKEFVVSIARNSLVNAQVGPDGNGNTVVVCMDLVK